MNSWNFPSLSTIAAVARGERGIVTRAAIGAGTLLGKAVQALWAVPLAVWVIVFAIYLFRRGPRRGQNGLIEDDELPPGQVVTCLICMCDSTEVNIPRSRLTARCNHRRNVCDTCAESHLHVEIVDNRQVREINCLQPDCGAQLSHADVKRLAAPEDFEQYEKLLFQKAVESLPNFRWCSNATCVSGQLHDVDCLGQRMVCDECGSATCFTHRVPWHEGKTCKQFDKAKRRRIKELVDTWRLRRQGIKRCPKCRHGIQKTEGCHHMTCDPRAGGCGAEFCWLCLADHKGPNGIDEVGLKAHKRWCRFYQ